MTTAIIKPEDHSAGCYQVDRPDLLHVGCLKCVLTKLEQTMNENEALKNEKQDLDYVLSEANHQNKRINQQNAELTKLRQENQTLIKGFEAAMKYKGKGYELDWLAKMDAAQTIINAYQAKRAKEDEKP